MSTKIGYLKTVIKSVGEELHGEIKTLQMQMKIKLVPDRFKKSENAPDYVICAVGSSGQEIQIGGAWIKKKSQIGDVDFEFLSITIDDPSLPSALNVAAFKNQNGDWDITWRRRQAGSNTPESQNAA